MTTPRRRNRTAAEGRVQAVRRDRAAAGARAALAPAPRPATEAVPGDGLREAQDYGRDLWERTILFWDTLRRRADNMLEHQRAGLPPLLDFRYETILDARRFDRPANYALLRITAAGEDCWEDCVDPTKRPVIVIDPRADPPASHLAGLALAGLMHHRSARRVPAKAAARETSLGCAPQPEHACCPLVE